jgi:hypothetical protein
MWTESANTSGGNIVFNDCDLSVTVNGSGCATYVLEKTTPATGNQQCGPFQITVNICTGIPNAGETLETCNNNGTPSNGTDDYITFSLNPTGSSLGATYSVTVNNGGTVTLAGGGAATGIAYGSATAFRLQNGSSNGTLYTITITDVSGAACTVTTTVQQSACSSCPVIPCGTTTAVKN